MPSILVSTPPVPPPPCDKRVSGGPADLGPQNRKVICRYCKGRAQLSHFYNQHGTMVFRGAVAASAWTRLTIGVELRRRKVIQLWWQEGLDRAPRRGKVVDMVMALGFKVSEIFATIHPSDSSEYDISFMSPLGMESFLQDDEGPTGLEVFQGDPSVPSGRY